MFDALYPEDADAALNAQLARPAPPAPETPWFKGFWGALGQAIPRAGAEMGRAATSLLTPEAVGALDAPSMFSAPKGRPKEDLATEIRQQDAAIRSAIQEMTPDPLTTGAASMILHDVTRFVGKAAAYGALGGMPGAVAGMTLDEGYNEAARRMDEGVDAATAAKLGITKGIASGIAVALPVAGKTIAQTVGLAAVGGPGGYIAEQATARKILENADYLTEADKIDPFDPMGLGVAFFGSLLFGAGAHAMRGGRAEARPEVSTVDTPAVPEAPVGMVPPGERTPLSQALDRVYSQEQVDAAHVSILQGQRESSALHAADDVAAAEGHARALDRASEQLATGQRVEVADVAPVDAARMVSELQTLVPRVESALARLEMQGFRSEPPDVAAANFGRWFEGSRVVDEAGQPLVVYHGTRADFSEFSPDAPGSAMDAGKLGRGFYFTEDARWASAYAKSEEGSNVMPAHLTLRNPVMFARSNVPVWNRLRQLSAEWGIKDDPVLPDSGNAPNPEWSARFSEEAQRRGFDGVILESVPGQREFVAFDPRQVKSAIGNSGKFDPNSASLTDAAPKTQGLVAQVTDAITNAARSVMDAITGSKPEAEPAPAKAEQDPAADFIAREADRIEQMDPDMLVMMEGMDAPVRVADLMAEAKAIAQQEMADAPLMQVAAECALRG